MTIPARVTALVVCMAWLAVGTEACGLAIGAADLNAVNCEQEGTVGTPACAEGQVCAGGQCVQCAATDTCTNGIDDDCDGRIDNGCVGTGGKDGGGAGMDSSAGHPGLPDAAKNEADVSTAETNGSGGSAASAGSAGAGGTGGVAGGGAGGASGSAPTGGSSGNGGAPATGGSAGDPSTGGSPPAGGSGGGPQCKPKAASCNSVENGCCSGYCCVFNSAGTCRNTAFDKCDYPDDCCSGKCYFGYCTAI
jgi:hypothetical protein